ncbi:hypothetical protein DKX38_015433 [Salix brachista]|uniref:Uncharacterized protein n=1 Tax=Salix brachista TaxID=2182728 RepID=A0A5N5L5K1_9ROSI|nr:hypothetical protein DKX38_015433 [Salix brachista]
MQLIDAQADAVDSLYKLAEVNTDCRLTLASEAADRLLKVIKVMHHVSEVCWKAAMISDSLVSEPQNKALLLDQATNSQKLVVFEVFDWKPFSALDHALKLD